MKIYLGKPYSWYLDKKEILTCLKQSWGNIAKIRSIAMNANVNIDSDEEFGVCRIIACHGNVSVHLSKKFIDKYGIKTEFGLRGIMHPVGGPEEFSRHMIDMWKNPMRLKYIEHCIEIFENVIENWSVISSDEK